MFDKALWDYFHAKTYLCRITPTCKYTSEMNDIIKGFSKLSKEEKISLILRKYAAQQDKARTTIDTYTNPDPAVQSLHDGFSENTAANYYMPFGLAPNFAVNGRTYCVPMVTEESSVVAASSKAAAFWAERGGFRAHVVSMKKKGRVHLAYNGDGGKLSAFFHGIKPRLEDACRPITANMEKRGGGIASLELLDLTDLMDGYYAIDLTADTRDSMGANFINSVLECIAGEFARLFNENGPGGDMQVVMSILSNYTPECLVHAEVSAPVAGMSDGDMPGEIFCNKFARAVRIAELSVERAVTHNKGIMNGIDAVVIATGNDFRAVEACAHAYAARNGKYSSLSHASVDRGTFSFSMEIPLALGTVGGLTKLHPLSALAMELLGNPSAERLMEITASVGLAQNFAAVRSLITSGIQRGHMKMHLGNILRSLGASRGQIEAAKVYFSDKTVSHSAVEDFLRNSNIM